MMKKAGGAKGKKGRGRQQSISFKRARHGKEDAIGGSIEDSAIIKSGLVGMGTGAPMSLLCTTACMPAIGLTPAHLAGMNGSGAPKPRFVRLGSRTLEYFRSDGIVAESKPLGVIEFSEVLRVTPGEASNPLQCVVQAQYRRYTLHADSAEQCTDWREKIEKAVDDFQEFEELAQDGEEVEPAELVEQLVEHLKSVAGGGGEGGAEESIGSALSLVDQLRRGLNAAQENMRQSAQFAAVRSHDEF